MKKFELECDKIRKVRGKISESSQTFQAKINEMRNAWSIKFQHWVRETNYEEESLEICLFNDVSLITQHIVWNVETLLMLRGVRRRLFPEAKQIENAGSDFAVCDVKQMMKSQSEEILI